MTGSHAHDKLPDIYLFAVLIAFCTIVCGQWTEYLFIVLMKTFNALVPNPIARNLHGTGICQPFVDLPELFA